jgi:hypothetical protein
MYILTEVTSKGKGLVAVADIPKGTRILEEVPTITTPDNQLDNDWLKSHISQQLVSLNEQQRQSLLSMHNIYPCSDVAEQCMGIIRTNALPVGSKGIGGAIFLEACRINHACDNNAQKNWNERIERHTVHALRDIAKGEEITIFYLGSDSVRKLRQKKLQDKFGFQCSCQLCSLPEEESRQSDRRLARIHVLDDLIGRDGMTMNFSLQTLRYTDESVQLYNEQGPGDSGLSRTYLDAAQISIAKGDLARGRIFAERAVDGWRTAYGNDSKEVIEHGALCQNPASLPLYGLSMDWKTSVRETPQGLDRGDFEDWLWRREKQPNLEQLQCSTGFRDREIFPNFAALPERDSVYQGIHEYSPDAVQPLRHWCFLGEIVDFGSLAHLEMELKDVHNKLLSLHFYTPEKGGELDATQIQIGYTVAVLYARRHRFVYGIPGIRHENPRMLQVRLMHLFCYMNYADLT